MTPNPSPDKGKQDIPPFYAGQKVIVIRSFERLRKVWGFSYPKKNDVVIVKSIRKHPLHDFWLIMISSCECELFHKSFAPIEEKFQAISLSKILEQETKLISVN